MPFWKLFHLYRGGQCTYPPIHGVLGVLLYQYTAQCSIHPKLLPCFSHHHCRINEQRWENPVAMTITIFGENQHSEFSLHTPLLYYSAGSNSLFVSVPGLKTRGRWFEPRLGQYYFPRIDESYFDRIHSSLAAVFCFDNGYVGKQPVASKEYCAD